MGLRVAVLHNEDLALSEGEESDALAVGAVEGAARDVADSLRSSGCDAEVLAVPDGGRELLARLARLDAELVFNLVESLGGDARREASFASALELSGLAYTGSGPRAMTLCLEKPLARAVLQAHGVPVPNGAVLRDGDEPLSALRFPVIVKPAREDASHGIALESVVGDERAARRRACYVIERYAQPALVEEYVDGREFNLTLLGTGEGVEVLEPAEMDFTGLPEGLPRIVTYAAKWVDSSVEWRHTRSVAPRRLELELAERLASLARSAYLALELRDYGRVDLRVDAADRAFVIDVNPNPDLSKDAGLSLTAGRNGISHVQLIRRIVQGALARSSAAAPA